VGLERRNVLIIMKKWLITGLIVLAGAGYYIYQDPAARDYFKQQSETVLPKTVTHTTVYKWKDKQGHWQITNTPPPEGIKYETVEYRKDTNVIPSERLTGQK
jgi:hypothetical protein